MGVGQAINTAQENLESMVPSADQIKAAGLHTCDAAMELCRGTSIKGEIIRTAKSFASAPIEGAVDIAKACTQITRPLQAAKTLAKGFGNCCYRVAEQVTSPVRLAGAAVKDTAHATVSAAKGAANLPFNIYHKGEEWIGRATDAVFGGEMTSANDNAVASASTPPPASSGPTAMAA